MSKSINDPLVLYLLVLRVIQPARIQDILRYAPSVLPEGSQEFFDRTDFENMHKLAKGRNLVMPVRRGSYHLSKAGMNFVSALGIDKELDNRRLYLMKDQRKNFGV